jgi:transposase
LNENRKRERVAPFVFEGNCNAEVFNTYVESVLIHELQPNDVVILDNASFHKSEKTKDLIEAANCNILFLPPYSPDMNLQENDWACLKNFTRNNLKNFNHNLYNIAAAFFNST